MGQKKNYTNLPADCYLRQRAEKSGSESDPFTVFYSLSVKLTC